MKTFPIFIEGYLDEAIISQTVDIFAIQSVYQIKREHFFIDRAKGINSVLKKVIKADKTCIGIIDDDKVKSKILDDFQFCGSLGNLNFYFLVRNKIHKFVIVFSPATEKWVLDSAISAGIDEAKAYKSNLKEFCKLTKAHSINNDILNMVKKVLNSSKHAIIFRRSIFRIISKY